MDSNICFVTSGKFIRVLYKGIYKGRIVETDEGFEYQKKGYHKWEHHINLKTHTSIIEAMQEATNKIKSEVKFNTPDMKLLGVTPKGINFLLKFEEPVLRKLLSSEEIKITNMFVEEGILEKGTSDDHHKSVIYYLDSSIKRLIK